MRHGTIVVGSALNQPLIMIMIIKKIVIISQMRSTRCASYCTNNENVFNLRPKTVMSYTVTADLDKLYRVRKHWPLILCNCN